MMSRATRRSRGFSYIEVLVATVVIAISLVPALEALQSGMLGSQHHGSSAADHYNLIAKFEEVLAEPLSALDAAATAAGAPTVPTSYSDAPGPGRRIVYLSRYDPSDADLLWVKVQLENSELAFETLTGNEGG